jgi:hypothetical protein
MMPGIQLMPHHMMNPNARPLFPAAVQTAAMGQHQQKPTFPAYSNATISAPPTTNLGSSSNASSTTSDTQPPTIPQNTGTASKIMHPPEDLSLEELKARKPQYKINKLSTISPQQFSQASAIPTSIAASIKASEASKMISSAHEVSSNIYVHAFHCSYCHLFKIYLINFLLISLFL